MLGANALGWVYPGGLAPVLVLVMLKGYAAASDAAADAATARDA